MESGTSLRGKKLVLVIGLVFVYTTVFCIFCQIADAEEKKYLYLLKLKYNPGEMITSEEKSNFDRETEISMELSSSMETRTVKQDMESSETGTSFGKFVDYVKEVSDKGELLKLKREFISMESKTEVTMTLPDGRETTSTVETPEELNLEGQTIVLEREEGSEEVDVIGLKKGQKRMLLEHCLGMNDELRYFFPEEEIEVGHKWTIDDDKTLRKILRADTFKAQGIEITDLSGSFECSLDEIIKEKKHEYARVSYKIDIFIELECNLKSLVMAMAEEDEESDSGKTENLMEGSGKIKGSGELILDLTTEKICSTEDSYTMNLNIEGEFEQEVVGPDGSKMDSSMKLRIKMETAEDSTGKYTVED